MFKITGVDFSIAKHTPDMLRPHQAYAPNGNRYLRRGRVNRLYMFYLPAQGDVGLKRAAVKGYVPCEKAGAEGFTQFKQGRGTGAFLIRPYPPEFLAAAAVKTGMGKPKFQGRVPQIGQDGTYCRNLRFGGLADKGQR
jgi:hypothetical protein